MQASRTYQSNTSNSVRCCCPSMKCFSLKREYSQALLEHEIAIAHLET